MANKRMFSLDVVDTDKFMDMPLSAQALYFHLGLRADDDGFVASPKKIIKIVDCKQDDLKVLVAKGFVIPFETGIIVIRHWKMQNRIQSDRYKPTKYISERSRLEVINSVYKLDTESVQDVLGMDTQYSIDKYSIDKSSIDKEIYVQPEVATPPELTPKKKTSRFLPPTEEEVKQYCLENGYTLDAQRFVDFYECKGWMVGKNKMKNWKAAVRTWARKDQGGVRDEPEPTNSIRLW